MLDIKEFMTPTGSILRLNVKHELPVGILKFDHQASEMTQWITVLATGPANLSSVPKRDGRRREPTSESCP